MPLPVTLLHQHIAKLGAERVRQRDAACRLGRAGHPPADHNLQQPRVGVPVGQCIFKQRQTVLRQAAQKLYLALRALQFAHFHLVRLRGV